MLQLIAHLMTLCVPCSPQQDAFADDTVRMIKQLRAANPQIQASIGAALMHTTHQPPRFRS